MAIDRENPNRLPRFLFLQRSHYSDMACITSRWIGAETKETNHFGLTADGLLHHRHGWVKPEIESQWLVNLFDVTPTPSIR